VSQIREQLKQAMSITPAPGGEAFAAEFAIPPDFVGFRGHFEGNPVVPGVCIIAAVVLGAETTLKCPLKIARVVSSKFYSPVLPNLRVVMEAAIVTQPVGYQVKAGLSSEGRKVAAISLLLKRQGTGATT
jgi:3-hydroxymyristoyl/3-hydroxydecanoyl-(acyl carrier protein) dehydratase